MVTATEYLNKYKKIVDYIDPIRVNGKVVDVIGLIIASIGPTGKMLVMGDVTEDDLYKAFKEQAVALEKGGADFAFGHATRL